MLDGSKDPSVLCALLGRLLGGSAGILGAFTASQAVENISAVSTKSMPSTLNEAITTVRVVA